MLIIFHVISPLSAYSGFHRQIKTKIPLADSQTLQQEWLSYQPKMKRYDISVLTKQSIPDILNYFQVKTSTYRLDRPAYNPYGRDFFCWELKDPPPGLLGVFLKPRNNPFHIRYPQGDEESTLTDLLKYEIALEEAFVFWDAHQQPPTEEINKELIVIQQFADQSKEDTINDYLIKNQIINEPLLIKLGCYNATPNTGLIVPLPWGNFDDLEIAAIYFDNGMRLLPEDEKTSALKKGITWREEVKQEYQTRLNQLENECSKEFLQKNIKELTEEINNLRQEIIKTQTYTLADLLKLANGAKKIYLFAFNIQKRIQKIELPDTTDPYQAIRDWKRDNNLYTFPPLVQEGNYKEHSEINDDAIGVKTSNGYEFNIPVRFNIMIHDFETVDCFYILMCKNLAPQINRASQYLEEWKKWMARCYLKPGIFYSDEEIRNKLGRSSKNVYDEKGESHWYYYKENPWWQRDEWLIDWQDTSRRYDHFLDTTRPSARPKELD
ncbi:MAG: hypothetical protein TB2022_3260 [Candidatus Phytoplasma citri]|nr:MAG: hypothetical protein TB2022_3260 [Candidatus Phytoplasma aurantifolia]